MTLKVNPANGQNISKTTEFQENFLSLVLHAYRTVLHLSTGISTLMFMYGNFGTVNSYREKI